MIAYNTDNNSIRSLTSEGVKRVISPDHELCYLITCVFKFCLQFREKGLELSNPESAPVKGKGIVLCPCEGILTVRSSSCGHSVHSYNLQTN